MGQQYLDLPVEGLAISVLVQVAATGVSVAVAGQTGTGADPQAECSAPTGQTSPRVNAASALRCLGEPIEFIDRHDAGDIFGQRFDFLVYYADRLLELPLALIGIALATVILPSLSADAAEGIWRHSRANRLGLRWVAILGVPASVALLVLAEPLITTIFYRGAMTALDVSMAALALQAYAAGLLGHMFVKIQRPDFSQGRHEVTSGNWHRGFGIQYDFKCAAIVWLGHIGLALATSASAFINAFLLWRRLRKARCIGP